MPRYAAAGHSDGFLHRAGHRSAADTETEKASRSSTPTGSHRAHKEQQVLPHYTHTTPWSESTPDSSVNANDTTAMNLAQRCSKHHTILQGHLGKNVEFEVITFGRVCTCCTMTHRPLKSRIEAIALSTPPSSRPTATPERTWQSKHQSIPIVPWLTWLAPGLVQRGGAGGLAEGFMSREAVRSVAERCSATALMSRNRIVSKTVLRRMSSTASWPRQLLDHPLQRRRGRLGVHFGQSPKLAFLIVVVVAWWSGL